MWLRDLATRDYILGMKLQKLDDLLLNLVVVFGACGIKGGTPLQVAEAA